MSILIALIPALCWGTVGILSTKFGGNAGQQALGISIGALVLGLIVTFGYVLPHHIMINSQIITVGFLSGLFWAVGIFGQLSAYKFMGVSIGFPLSTAGQIVLNALMGAAVLGEWYTGNMWLVGIVSILIVTVGAMLIAAGPKNQKKAKSTEFNRGISALIFSTLGFMLYFVFPNLMVKFGYISQEIRNVNNGLNYMVAIITPQALGQIVGSLLIILFILRDWQLIFKIETAKNIITGLDWAFGNVCMFISAANPAIGQAIATTLSQMGVVVGTFGGIFILHERKTHDQMNKIILGTIGMIVGGVLIANIDKVASLF